MISLPPTGQGTPPKRKSHLCHGELLASHHATHTAVVKGQHQNHRLARQPIVIPTFQGRRPGIPTPRTAETERKAEDFRDYSSC